MMAIFALLISSLLITCGLSAIAPTELIPPLTGRIVGGRSVPIESYPYQVYISYRYNTYYQQFCGGAVLRNRIIVTAAHCVYNKNHAKLAVFAGSTYKVGNPKRYAFVQRYIVHKHYNPDTFQNDIALIVLSSDIGINGVSIRAISLATENPKVGSMVTITGWGKISQNGISSEILQAVDVPIVGKDYCQAVYRKTKKVTDDMICGGYKNARKNSCQGDSGGPVVYNNKLVGLVSWASGCAEPGIPAVYTSTVYFRKWIEEHIH